MISLQRRLRAPSASLLFTHELGVIAISDYIKRARIQCMINCSLQLTSFRGTYFLGVAYI